MTIFHYSLSGQIIAESNSAGTIKAEYVYFNGQPLAKMEGTNTYYYHNDHLGTPQKLTDSTGTVKWSADYKPFGEVNITTNDITNNLRFPGQYYDAETGLNYNLNRDYNQGIGRYIEGDPLGIEKGRNHLYVYVGNNPVNLTDSLGLFMGGQTLPPGTFNPFNPNNWPSKPGKCLKCKPEAFKCLDKFPQSPTTNSACMACALAIMLSPTGVSLTQTPSCITCGGSLALEKTKCFTDNCSVGTQDCEGNCK